MHVTGHVDYDMVTVDRAVELGLRNFEHAFPWVLSAISDSAVSAIAEDVARRAHQRYRVCRTLLPHGAGTSGAGPIPAPLALTS
jgi:hypothetical protein